jgi:tRNA(Ile)-lysidine synthase TilS/MesJ
MDTALSYLHWQEAHHQTLKTFSQKKIVISFSGGKDSSLLLDFFLQAQKEYGFDLHAHGVAFPRHVFSAQEQNRLSLYWQGRGIDIVWHGASDEQEAGLDQLVAKEESPCVLCGQTKKASLFAHFKAEQTDWNNLVIVIGYTLWDLASATIEHTLRVGFGGGGAGNFQGKSPEDRFLEISQRFYPLLKLDNGLMIFKPLIQYNDSDIAAAAEKINIPMALEPCRFKFYRPKRLLADYYNLFGLNFNYNDVFKFAKTAFNLPEKQFFQKLELKSYVDQMI